MAPMRRSVMLASTFPVDDGRQRHDDDFDVQEDGLFPEVGDPANEDDTEDETADM